MLAQRIVLVAACVVVAGWANLAAAAPDHAPTYFDPAHEAPAESLRSAELRPPPPASDVYGHLGGDHFDHAQVQQQRLAHLRRRQAVQGPQDSSSNPHDKLQMLGFIGSAYNLPLNVSSNPAQRVFVQLDTGSSDLWIVSAGCQSQQCRSGEVLKFDEGRSLSYRPLNLSLVEGQSVNVSSSRGDVGGSSSSSSRGQDGQLYDGTGGRRIAYAKRQAAASASRQVPFRIAYDDGTAASGLIASENFTISDLGVTDQLFALVNRTNVTLTEQGISGVMGFGFPRGSVIARSLAAFDDQLGPAKDSPLAFSLLQGSDLSYPLFGISLARDGGRITFGAVDPRVLPQPADRAQIEWHDVVPFPSGNTALPASSSYNFDEQALGAYVSWTLRLTDAGAAGQSAQLKPTFPAVGADPLALLDTGTSSIVGPPAGVEAIFRHITNARHVGGGRFVVPCDTRDRMHFSFGGRNITLLPDDYIIGPASSQPQLCFAWPAAVEPGTDGVDWVLGTPFLRAVYSVYSIGLNGKEPPKIGLYPLRQPADATDPATIFAPEPEESVSAFLREHATTVASVLPNSLVSVPVATSATYAFVNASATASIGVAPTSAGGPSTYSPLLTAQSGISGVPAISSKSTPLPIPSNPATTGDANGALPAPAGLAALLATVAAAASFASLLL
ncbi:uncharacterized protein PFL1_03080 [Pseudozyma flocculosa PF-1]|uniref:Related to MKC7 - aspartyl protease of the periplasmic space n=2 Tax=Pseudozyma flocculosa TaxID=84751 RepID=A0A5C3F3J6_9BASI|nr:uncharacterized protein PFL1_03080 [Pseudozyma flocculosa PF-1]EPQ29325.1 hypothetical protein PFL1_03080 [Pseudozyma flocculosa PF-1]SPO37841.1 related to MKC7 - aspartyl protease of the periplasmic space [Pseudozyma flocculosa]